MKRNLLNNSTWLLVVLFLAFAAPRLSVLAGDVYLSNNSGADNAVFFIKDEPSLVINALT